MAFWLNKRRPNRVQLNDVRAFAASASRRRGHEKISNLGMTCLLVLKLSGGLRAFVGQSDDGPKHPLRERGNTLTTTPGPTPTGAAGGQTFTDELGDYVWIDTSHTLPSRVLADPSVSNLTTVSLGTQIGHEGEEALTMNGESLHSIQGFEKAVQKNLD